MSRLLTPSKWCNANPTMIQKLLATLVSKSSLPFELSWVQDVGSINNFVTDFIVEKFKHKMANSNMLRNRRENMKKYQYKNNSYLINQHVISNKIGTNG